MTPDPSTIAGARALERLATEKIGWLTTLNPDDQPQSSPVWFLWTDGELFVYSAKRAPRNANLEDRPRVAFNLNTDAGGDDVVTMEGTARIEAGGPAATDNPAYLAKYRTMLADYGWTDEHFATEYPFLVRITPTRWRTS